MTIREFFITGFHDGRTAVRQHPRIALALIVLIALGGSSRFLRGDLLGFGGVVGIPGASTPEPSLRSCSSEGTIFEGVDNLEKVKALYRRTMSTVVGEREGIFRNPSQWKCGTGAAGEPPTPFLKTLANGLPGWHYRADVSYLFGSLVVPIPRPVTFASFGSIVAELQREYECKLTEIQDRNLVTIIQNNDIEQAAEFCCIAPDGIPGCRQQADGSLCLNALTSDPLCGGECPGLLYMSDLAYRSPTLHAAVLEERSVSREAVERTLSTLRSFEMNYSIARQMVCYQRASLDLKNEMSLLADAVSCMPKIWDAVTSIHDRKEP